MRLIGYAQEGKMFCSKCGKELKEPQDVCCDNVYIRRKDDAIVIVDRRTADVMVIE